MEQSVINTKTHHAEQITGITVQYKAYSKMATIKDSEFGIFFPIDDFELIKKAVEAIETNIKKGY